ncbi:recombinase family protein [Pedobacter sp. AW1-32]|uniref:recombinase family protein n=1 Tax=Pedobacter sp. AW1-32 TaxID=3383026 RepID=UPI003FEECB34
MKTAYLYVRVSTDEQKRKGYSLPEQEDQLLRHCDHYGIAVKGIYREDFSAKNFNRPEWKKMVATIRSDQSTEKNILFIKWDRFSRNIEYAYEMIGLLRKFKTVPMAIDQPIDFSIPESSVMLAVYLSVPEAENTRRALNTANGIRRAKLLGRYPNKAPLGYINLAALDGKKYIAQKQPEAAAIRWVFQQLAKNSFKIEEVRKMVQARGLDCSRSYFAKLIRNPVYCGLVKIQTSSGEIQMIKGLHVPLISESLFFEVQNIINTNRKPSSKTEELKTTFFLKGYLFCPVCNRKLRGSFSRGSSRRYPYYHCSGSCKVRANAELLNNSYDSGLQGLVLSKKALGLFSLVLEDINVGTQRVDCLRGRRILLKQIDEQDAMLSKARKLFVADRLKFDDFKEIKKECLALTDGVKKELGSLNAKLRFMDRQSVLWDRSSLDVFRGYLDMEASDKKQLVSLMPPVGIDIHAGRVSLGLGEALSKILLFKK